MLTEKLPKVFQTDPLITKLAQFIQDKKVMFSSIVYVHEGKKYVTLKG